MVDPSGLQIVTAFRFGRARGVGQAGGAPPGGRERRRLCSFSFGGPGPVADWDYRAQSSEPCTPSSAENSSVVPTTVSDAGEELAGPGLMSSTSIVPAAVPSDVHSSWPWAEPSVAEKNTAEPSTIGGPIDEPPGPGLMSSTSIEVPNATSESGLEPSEPGAMSFTITVVDALPFDFHNSRPCDLLSTAEKNRVPFTSVRPAGKDEIPDWPAMSLTSRVPAAVDFHSSVP